MEQIDLGEGHYATWFGWHPDRELNPQFADRPDIERLGLAISHPPGPGPRRPELADGYARAVELGVCKGAVTLDVPGAEAFGDRPRWTVESWDPLTIAPSVLCNVCGDHGYVQGGRWVPAG